jgi:hypothetical protein
LQLLKTFFELFFSCFSVSNIHKYSHHPPGVPIYYNRRTRYRYGKQSAVFLFSNSLKINIALKYSFIIQILSFFNLIGRMNNSGIDIFTFYLF